MYIKTLTIQGFKSCEHVKCWEPEWSVSNNYNHRPRSDSDRAVFRKAQCGSRKKRLRQEQFLRRSVAILRDWRDSMTKLNICSHPVRSLRCLHFYVSRGTSIPSSRGCFYFNYSFCIWYVCILPDSLSLSMTSVPVSSWDRLRQLWQSFPNWERRSHPPSNNRSQEGWIQSWQEEC